MFTLLRNITSREVIFTEAPSFFLSLLIAELFYKWHSFLLECIGFLVTWYCISFVFNMIRNWFSRTSHG
jgi:hypothetical protein